MSESTGQRSAAASADAAVAQAAAVASEAAEQGAFAAAPTAAAAVVVTASRTGSHFADPGVAPAGPAMPTVNAPAAVAAAATAGTSSGLQTPAVARAFPSEAGAIPSLPMQHRRPQEAARAQVPAQAPVGPSWPEVVVAAPRQSLPQPMDRTRLRAWVDPQMLVRPFRPRAVAAVAIVKLQDAPRALAWYPTTDTAAGGYPSAPATGPPGHRSLQ